MKKLILLALGGYVWRKFSRGGRTLGASVGRGSGDAYRGTMR